MRNEIKAIITNIIDWLKEHETEANEAIEELDNYNSFLGDERYYPMDDLEELTGFSAMEAIRRAFYGYDENWFNEEKGRYEPFNPNADYFRLNGYGNLVSASYPNYTSYIDNNLVLQLAENRDDISIIEDNEELEKLFDKLEEEAII